MTQSTRRIVLTSLMFAPFAALLAALPRPAAAHAVLLSSQPAAGSSVTAGSVAFSLRFNSRIDRNRSRAELIGANGERRVLTISPGGPDDTLEVTMIVPPGPNVLRWQVLAFDGHVTRGEVQFTAVRQ